VHSNSINGVAYQRFIDVARGREFGPAPYYGETGYAGRGIEQGYRYG